MVGMSSKQQLLTLRKASRGELMAERPPRNVIGGARGARQTCFLYELHIQDVIDYPSTKYTHHI